MLPFAFFRAYWLKCEIASTIYRLEKKTQMVLKAGVTSGCTPKSFWFLKVRSSSDIRSALAKISVPQPGISAQLAHIRMNNNKENTLENNLEVFTF